MVERHKVVLFLELMKRTAQTRFTFVQRQKTLESFAQLGITRPHAQQLVLGLRPEDYVSGPTPDNRYPSLEMWVFGLHVSAHEIYIKLQLVADSTHCVCVSFHIAERPMHYPLREARSDDSTGEAK